MGLFNKDLKDERSAAQIVSETTDKVIQTLAGDSSAKRRRVVDNIAVFIGAAGGVGTSTLVANVAVELEKRGMQVLVVDINIQYPAQHAFFGIEQTIEKKDLVSFMMGQNSIGESIQHVGGISVMYANNRNLVDSVACDSDKCSANMWETMDNIDELYDVILFDCGNDLSYDLVNTTLFRADQIYLVWNEGLSCVANTDRIRRNMALTGIESGKKVRVVMNKRTSIHYPKYPLKELGIELAEVLPYDQSIIECGLRGEVYVRSGASLSRNAAGFVSGISRLADKILEAGGYEH